MSDTSKSKQISLSKSEEHYLEELGSVSDFWGSVLRKYAEYDGLTQRQYDLLTREIEKHSWKRGAQLVDGKPVRNKFLTDDQPRCAHRETPYCQRIASAVVGTFGYCSDHLSPAQIDFDAWKASRSESHDLEVAS